MLEGQTWVIELNVGREESVGLHVRGAGDDAVEAVARVADALGGAGAIDISTGDVPRPGKTEVPDLAALSRPRYSPTDAA